MPPYEANYNLAVDATENMLEAIPTILRKEYDTETRQLTVYCTDGSVYRLQIVQIN